jgi:hypothetical protein
MSFAPIQNKLQLSDVAALFLVHAFPYAVTVTFPLLVLLRQFGGIDSNKLFAVLCCQKILNFPRGHPIDGQTL